MDFTFIVLHVNDAGTDKRESGIHNFFAGLPPLDWRAFQRKMDIFEREIFDPGFFGHGDGLIKSELAQGVGGHTNLEAAERIAAGLGGGRQKGRWESGAGQNSRTEQARLQEAATIDSSRGNVFHNRPEDEGPCEAEARKKRDSVLRRNLPSWAINGVVQRPRILRLCDRRSARVKRKAAEYGAGWSPALRSFATSPSHCRLGDP